MQIVNDQGRGGLSNKVTARFSQVALLRKCKEKKKQHKRSLGKNGWGSKMAKRSVQGHICQTAKQSGRIVGSDGGGKGISGEGIYVLEETKGKEVVNRQKKKKRVTEVKTGVPLRLVLTGVRQG